jgi:O-antigen/teichoic acid export membrane protein
MSGVAVLVTNVLITFVMTPIIVHSLGNRNYGIWELLVGLVGYLGVLEFGIGPALVRFVADAHSREDRTALNQIFNTGAVTLAALGTLGLVVVLGLARWPAQFLPLPASEAQELTPLLVVFGLNLAASLPRVAFSGYLLGLQEHRTVNLLEIVLTLIQSVVIYHVLTAGWSSPLIWLSALMFLKSTLQALLMLSWILLVDRQVRLKVSAFRFQTMKELMGYGAKNTVLRASIGMLQKLMGFAIAYTAGIGQVVYFVVPNRLIEYAQSLASELGLPLIPYFTSLAGKGDSTSTRQAWIQTTRILQVVTFWAALVATGAGEPFIRAWMGPEYADHGYWVLYILCFGLFAHSLGQNSIGMLMSLGRHGGMAVFAAVYAVVCFAISVGLGSVWGIEGVATAVCLYAVGMSLAGLILACRILEVPLKEHVRANILPFVVPIAIGGSAFFLLREIRYPSGYGWLIVHSSLASAAYLIPVWFLALNTVERTFVKERIFRHRVASKSGLAESLGGEDK